MIASMDRWLMAVIAVLILVYAIAALTTFPALFPDPSYGLLVDRSWRAGSPWNYVYEPSANNIANDEMYFHTTWSPGQYLVPGALMTLGLATGDALRVVNILTAVVGLAGWYGLIRALGFDRTVTLGVCAVTALSRTFSFSFLTYSGSDQLAFAGFPYLAMGLLALRHHWTLAAAVPAALVIGFLLKNSMAIYLTAWIAAIVLVPARITTREERARSLAMIAMVGAAGAAALWAIDALYVSRGWTPMSYSPHWSSDWSRYLLPTAMPVIAGTGVDGVLSRAFDRSTGQLFDYKRSLLLLLPIVVASVAWVWFEWRRTTDERRRAALGFVGLVVVAFTMLLATGSGASLDLSRHYVLLGIVLLPFMIERLRQSGTAPRALIAMLLIVPAVYGVASFGSNWRRHSANRAVHTDRVRVAHLTLTAGDLDDLQRLDRAWPSIQGLVVLPIPALALEFSQARVLATSATSDGIADFEKRPMAGRVDNLVVVVEPAGQTDDEVRAWLSSFRDYGVDRWRSVPRARLTYYVPDGQALEATRLEQLFNGGDD